MTCPPKTSPSAILDLGLEECGLFMGTRLSSEQQIMGKLGETEVPLSQGAGVGKADEKIGIARQAYRAKRVSRALPVTSLPQNSSSESCILQRWHRIC